MQSHRIWIQLDDEAAFEASQRSSLESTADVKISSRHQDRLIKDDRHPRT